MLSQTAQYALRAVIHLAEAPGTRPVRVGEIADALDVPRNYLSKTLHALVRAGVLTSVRGPHGGFRLARSPAELRLAAVVGPFDGLDGERRCLLGRPECGDAMACSAHHRWKEVSARVHGFFGETTVADLMVRSAAGAEAG